ADVRGVSYATFDDLLHYCRCVAGSIGRLSLGVFGTSDPQQAVPLADSLGVALQLTNILRDIREDYATGRVYLPAEDFARFGCALGTDPATDPGQGRLTALVEFEAARARTWYAQGLPRPGRPCRADHPRGWPRNERGPVSTQTAAPHVAVVGGGLAGITAAIALAETGTRVTLLESRPRLGGATCSFSRGGLTVDNG